MTNTHQNDSQPTTGRDATHAHEAGQVAGPVDHREPLLGLATTEHLIRELGARAEISRIAGESWPGYRTVDPQPADEVAAAVAAERDLIVKELQAVASTYRPIIREALLTEAERIARSAS